MTDSRSWDMGDPEPEHEPRWFWWPRDRFYGSWWPFVWGGDEFARRTLGIRVPGGMFFLCLWRFRDWSGPCAKCGQWEPTEHWTAPFCHACTYEVADRERGCICRSWRVAELDDEWPSPDCPIEHVMHGQST